MNIYDNYILGLIGYFIHNENKVRSTKVKNNKKEHKKIIKKDDSDWNQYA